MKLGWGWMNWSQSGSGSSPAAPSLDADTDALFSRLSGAYTSLTKTPVDTFIKAMKAITVATGVTAWSRLDFFYGQVFGGEDGASGNDDLLDWTPNARNLAKVGSPTWVAGYGWSGDDAGNHVANAVNQNGAGISASQNSCWAFSWCLQTNAQNNARSLNWGAARHLHVPRTTSNVCTTRCSDGSSQSDGASDSRYSLMTNRTGSSAYDKYIGAGVAVNKVVASAAPQAGVFILGQGGQPTTFAAAGGDMGSQSAAVQTAIAALATSLGYSYPT